jgi:hypothetical protein
MFKKVNILKDKISVSNADFSRAINLKTDFGITIDGKVVFEKSENEILVFWGRGNLVAKNQILGTDYGVTMTFATVLIDLSKAWDRIVELNKKQAFYEDDSSEGIDVFHDEKIEKISWYGVEFDVKPRNIADELENFADGYIIGIETEEPYRFDGMGFLNPADLEKSQKHLFEFAKNKISEKIENEKEEYKEYGFSFEEMETLEFFGIGNPFETK